MLHQTCPVAWSFHFNTVRWPFNMLEPAETPAPVASFKEYPLSPRVQLPERQPLQTPLEDAIAGRRSCRRFADAPVTLRQVATVLDASYGVRERMYLQGAEHFTRPVPSGGGLYPLEVYVLARSVESTEPGVYHYAPLIHALEHIADNTFGSAMLGQLFMGQPYIDNAGAIIVMTSIVERTLHKYGDRGYRYVLFEAGHVAQNACLACAALGLGVLNLGGFFDRQLANLLGIDLELELPLYALALGNSTTSDPEMQRTPG